MHFEKRKKRVVDRRYFHRPGFGWDTNEEPDAPQSY